MIYEPIEEILHANHIPLAYKWRALPKDLLDWLKLFVSGLEEMRMRVIRVHENGQTRQILRFQSLDGLTGQGREMNTALEINASDFDTVECAIDNASVAFSLKEFKAALALAASLGQVATCSFQSNGQPIVVETNVSTVIRVKFVLATIAETDEDDQETGGADTSHLPDMSYVHQHAQQPGQTQVNATATSALTSPFRVNSTAVIPQTQLTALQRKEVEDILSQSALNDDWFSDEDGQDDDEIPASQPQNASQFLGLF